MGRVFLDVIVRPSQAFSYVKENPKWLWLLVAILLVAGIVAKTTVATPLAQELAEKPPASFTPIMLLSGIVFGILGLAIAWFLKTAFFYLITRVWGRKIGFLALFSAMGLTYFPFFIRNFWQSLAMAATGKLIQHQGLAALVATSNPIGQTKPIYTLLSKIDIFLVWSLFLLLVALIVSVELSRRRALILVITFLALLLIGTVLPSYIFAPFIETFLPQGPM